MGRWDTQCGYTDAAGGVSSALLLFFAAARHNDAFDMGEARELLGKLLQRRWAKNWPAPIGRFLPGKIDRKKLRPECPEEPSGDLESDFYVAVSDLASGCDNEFFFAKMQKYLDDTAVVDEDDKERSQEYFLAVYESRS